jgi:hypothetical protein
MFGASLPHHQVQFCLTAPSAVAKPSHGAQQNQLQLTRCPFIQRRMVAGFGQRHIPIASGIGFGQHHIPQIRVQPALALSHIEQRPGGPVLAVPLYGPRACNSFLQRACRTSAGKIL